MKLPCRGTTLWLVLRVCAITGCMLASLFLTALGVLLTLALRDDPRPRVVLACLGSWALAAVATGAAMLLLRALLPPRQRRSAANPQPQPAPSEAAPAETTAPAEA